MTRGSHIIIGTLAAAGAHVLNPSVDLWWTIPSAMLGSTFPDFDLIFPHRTYVITERDNAFWMLVLHVFRGGRPIIFSVGIKHRTVTHGIIWPLGLYLFSAGHPMVFGLALGWVMHIIADATTIEGIPPFWPLPWRIRGLITTGSILEYFVVALLAGASGAYLFRGG